MRKTIGLFVVLALVFVAGIVLRGKDSVATVSDQPGVGVELVAQGLTSPVAFVQPKDGTGRAFIVDQVGLIRILNPDGTLLPEPFLDLRPRMVELRSGYDERGLLGLDFHPDFAQNRRFFVYYSAPLRSGAPEGWDHTSHLSEFSVSAKDPNRADQDSERIVLQVDQPQTNHNAGMVVFGPDRLLYVSLGDGGGSNDTGPGHVEDWYEKNPGGNAQNIRETLLGSIIRIDVNRGDPYGIPSDNPFVGREGLDEIFAYGLRNPYRFSFDMGGNRELFSDDAGQELREEINIIVKGGNYGWNVKEGTICFDAQNPQVPLKSCPDTDPQGNRLIDPVIEFANSKQPDGLGLVVIGGHVYRGSRLPQFFGHYIFGAWSSARGEPDGVILVSEPQSRGQWPIRELRVTTRPNGRLGHFVLAFGQDSSGEMYVLTTENTGPTGTTGKVFKLVPATPQ